MLLPQQSFTPLTHQTHLWKDTFPSHQAAIM
jgi:hypothetical protein